MSKRKQVQVPIEKIQEQDRFIEAIAEKKIQDFMQYIKQSQSI